MAVVRSKVRSEKKGGGGCGGCIGKLFMVALVLLLLVVAAGVGAFYWAKSKADTFTSADRLELPVPPYDEARLNELLGEIEGAQSGTPATQSGAVEPVVLDPNDLNFLLAHHPDFGHVTSSNIFVKGKDDTLAIITSIPNPFDFRTLKAWSGQQAAPTDGMRYLNYVIVLKSKERTGSPFQFEVSKFSSDAEAMTDEVEQQFTDGFNQNLASPDTSGGNPPTMKIEDGKLILEPVNIETPSGGSAPAPDAGAPEPIGDTTVPQSPFMTDET